MALLGLGMVLKKSLRLGWSRLRTTIWAALVIVGCIGTTYFAQLALVNHLVDRSTPDERARAALGVPMTYLMMHHDFKLTGLNLTPGSAAPRRQDLAGDVSDHAAVGRSPDREHQAAGAAVLRVVRRNRARRCRGQLSPLPGFPRRTE